jgi:N-acetylglucosamine-6-sulfatase
MELEMKNTEAKTMKTFHSLIAALRALFLIAGLISVEGMKAQSMPLSRPNLILILTDDLEEGSIAYPGPIAYMPQIRSLLVNQGLTFSNLFVTRALCCPSRASILRGQYPHNHTIQSNRTPDGGEETFRELGLDSSTIATWLQAAGYQTVLIGKYLNGYGWSPRYVPPGWNEWYAGVEGKDEYYNYKVNENGQIVFYGSDPEDYLTDVEAGKATDFIRRTTAPFFIYLAPSAPHGNPPTPAPRHVGFFADMMAPRPPSFNEADMSDKPTWLRSHPLLGDRQIDKIDSDYRARLETMLAVDDMVAALVQALRETGQLNNTFILFTSDNGYHQGEHRLSGGKDHAYQEDIRVPLIVRGPGVPAGQTVDHQALNTDLAPTLAELARASAPEFIDGRSLVPVLSDTPPPLQTWRQRFLVERWPPSDLENPEVNHMLQTLQYTYTEYLEENELYDLSSDPYQLENFYSTANPDLIAQLVSQLDVLKVCAGAGCRAAEDRATPAPTPSP